MYSLSAHIIHITRTFENIITQNLYSIFSERQQYDDEGSTISITLPRLILLNFTPKKRERLKKKCVYDKKINISIRIQEPKAEHFYHECRIIFVIVSHK